MRSYEAHASEFSKLGRIPVLKARMNADLHMGGELKATGKGNLFVVFGEPDIEILHEGDGRLMVHVKGVDVFDRRGLLRPPRLLPRPERPLRCTEDNSLKAEINADVWATLNSEVSRSFPTPKSGRIAVKVINHLGDEVMKVFRVE